MPGITPIGDREARGPVKEAFDEARRMLGTVPQVLRVLAHDPRALTAAMERIRRAFGAGGPAAQAASRLAPGNVAGAIKGAAALGAAVAARAESGAVYMEALRRLGFDDAALVDLIETARTALDIDVAHTASTSRAHLNIFIPLPIEED